MNEGELTMKCKEEYENVHKCDASHEKQWIEKGTTLLISFRCSGPSYDEIGVER